MKKMTLPVMMLCFAGLALAQVVVPPVTPPTAPVYTPPAPPAFQWRATLDATQTVAAVEALASKVQLAGFDLANCERANLVVQLMRRNGKLVAVLTATAYTNAPAKPQP